MQRHRAGGSGNTRIGRRHDDRECTYGAAAKSMELEHPDSRADHAVSSVVQ